MPCSDSEARNYIEDHRTQSLMKEQRDLEKHIEHLNKELKKNKTENEVKLEANLERLRQNNLKLAKKLNKTAELLCEATFRMFREDNETQIRYQRGFGEKIEGTPTNLLKSGTELNDWFLEHTEEDANRMKGELDKIVNHKSYTLQALFKWYEKLNEKEQWVFKTHHLFKGIKLNG